MTYDFKAQQNNWSKLPVDDIGYIPADQVSESHVEQAGWNRYGGWRNYDGKWRKLLGLDDTHKRVIFDFGSGIGLDSSEFVKMGNKVYSADINQASIDVASKCGSIPILVTGEYPFWDDIKFDLFFANGSLHHVPYARKILERAIECGAKEFRLMLYSDKAWEKHGKDQAQFARAMDFEGVHADWYSEQKLKDEFGDILKLKSCDYITPDGQYLIAIMEAL